MDRLRREEQRVHGRRADMAWTTVRTELDGPEGQGRLVDPGIGGAQRAPPTAAHASEKADQAEEADLSGATSASESAIGAQWRMESAKL